MRQQSIAVVPKSLEPRIRKPISKRTRFEVFKRDSFTCRFCGRTPPEAVLEIDHLVAFANGGSDEIVNLVTSCYVCNRGKSDKMVTEILSPDAKIESLRIQQEIAETKRYLDQRLELDRLNLAVFSYLREQWSIQFHRLSRVSLGDKQIKCWIATYSPDELVSAWEIVASHLERGKVFQSSAALLAYTTGVLKNRRTAEEKRRDGDG